MDKIAPSDPHHYAPLSQLIKGVILNLSAWCMFTVMTALIKTAQKDVPLPVILFFQNFIGVIVLLPLVIKNSPSVFINRPWKLLGIRCIFGQLNMFLLFLAVSYTSLTNTMLLGNSAPIFIPFICLFWLRQKIRLKIWPGIILGFVGIYLILKPDDAIISMDMGAFFALLAGICLAVILISVRLLSLTEKNYVILFYLFLAGLVIFAPLTLFFWKPLTFENLSLIILAGFLLLVGQYLLVKSFTYGETSQLSPFSYSVVIYSLILDAYLYQRIPTRISFIGIALFCLSGIVTMLLTTPKRSNN